MAAFLKMVSGFYLILVWLVVAGAFLASSQRMGIDESFYRTIAILSGVIATVPAAAMFAFAKLVDDTDHIKEHLAAIRKYYEPDA